MSAKTILIVEDEDLFRWSLKKHFERRGFRVREAESGVQGFERLQEERPHLVLCDVKLPDLSGLEVLARVKALYPDLPVVIMTAYGNVKTAVEAIKNGAADYVTKPCELDEVLLVVERAMETSERERGSKALYVSQAGQFAFSKIIGSCPAFRQVMELAKQVAASERTACLIQGESGVGKDLLAKVIHYESSRSTRPFVEVDCTSLPETLIESELFGYERGAFTDAKQRREGLVEKGEGGTVFFNEIGDLPQGMQAKLLRVVEDRTFRRVGGREELEVDVRIVAATNRDLGEMVEKKLFRGDLFYRLNVVPILMPPLRERQEDIVPLAKFFVEQFAREMRKSPPALSEEVQKIFLRYAWPGNVRQVRNVMERVLIVGGGKTISTDHLPEEMKGPGIPTPTEPPSGASSLKNWERHMVSDALVQTSGNQVKAAKLLGISRDVLRYKAKKYGLIGGKED